jgi:methionyl-tRNA formyltransferase
MSFKIHFMGTPEFAVPVLKSINNSNHEVLTVYTQSPKKKARGQKIIESPIHQCANKLNIPVRFPKDINSDEEYNFIKNSKVDIVIVVAYGKILPSKILNLPNIKFINIHASLLPKWRGAAPIQRAIMNKDKETGISIMEIVKELDAGPVMKFVKTEIKKDTTYGNLSDKLSNLSASTILDCLSIIEKKKENFVPQNHTKATYAQKIDKSETKINWNDKAENIVAKINSLHPKPGCWFKLNNYRVKVLEAKEIEAQGKPGEIINNQFSIACSENAIQILYLKKEGKNSMSASNFIIGNKLKVGTNLNEL